MQTVGLIFIFLFLCLFVAMGMTAIIDPVRFVKLHNRFLGDRSKYSEEYDPVYVQQSRNSKLQHRAMGLLLILFGAYMLNGLFRSLLR